MTSVLDTTPSVTRDATPRQNAVNDTFAPEHITIIERRSGWHLLDWKELVAYRDLFRFLIWREIKVRYAQSAIGIGWAIIQPLFSMLVFTIVFGRLAKVESDGVPYALFSFAALVPWTYFSNAVTDGVNALVSEANMLRKIYFPRILMPLSAVAAKLVDFTIAMCMLAILMIFYRHAPSLGILALPLLVALMMLTASAISLWLTALAVQYRDVKHAMGFMVQLAMYGSPVVYATSLIPEQYRLLYAINPMVGVIEGFRSALLGTQPMPWDLIAVGILSASVLFITGLAFFRSKERTFADVA
ncbi:ABC transporter permease [Novipirellula artificiosorum]|uniref:Transport permease protein n=1 Tax=Novipirellula artificiosorum TaxID=2528016 RepID=A0A5C6D1P7_9BACT|nr:ABC transporter permease [Novipirellula artificiosorum]TWU29136.1 Teichoic acid translocation permease protein TagG [Novipirellula artificiosorum]